MIRIGLLGAKGRMGEHVTRLLEADFSTRAVLAVAVNRGDLLSALLKCDAVIDFSAPEAVLALAQEALTHTETLPAFVIGSTGWKSEDKRLIEDFARRTPTLMSSNFSTGVLVLQDILRSAAPILTRLSYTPVIVESHHKHKKDAPSGTALALQRAISPSAPGEVQTHSIRAGEVIGDHEVVFHGTGDRLTFAHHAADRSVFAHGAIEAAIWLAENRARLAGGKGLISIEQYFQAIKESS